jgi:multidrug efflux pump subunit AcrA (membrane-fusion protein)
MAASSQFRIALVWVGLVAVLGISSWMGWKALRDAGPAEGAGPAGARPPSVVIVRTAVEKEVVEVLKVTGTLRAVRRAEVAALESGAVQTLAVDEGDLVEEGGLLARIDARRLDAQVQEAEADLIHADRLQLIPDVDGRSRLFVLVAHIPDPGNRLTPGLSVEASVPLGKPRPRLVVSTDAVMRGYSGTHVFVPKDTGKGPPLASRVPVEVLFEREGEAVLKDGALEPGTPVIVEGNERLFPNTPLDPRPWEETRAEQPPAKPKPGTLVS